MIFLSRDRNPHPKRDFVSEDGERDTLLNPPGVWAPRHECLQPRGRARRVYNPGRAEPGIM